MADIKTIVQLVKCSAAKSINYSGSNFVSVRKLSPLTKIQGVSPNLVQGNEKPSL